MSTHDYVIDNQSATAFRADLNAVLAAIVTQNSNAVAPTTTFANMIWYDTATNILKKRNEANSAWISLGTIDETAGTFTPSGQNTNVQTFTASGTWTKPAGANTVLVRLWGAGGGGASGELDAVSTIKYGGYGGGGGAYEEQVYLASDLANTVTVTIGAGGAGGAAVANTSSNGSAGADGGETRFGTAILRAYGGDGASSAIAFNPPNGAASRSGPGGEPSGTSGSEYSNFGGGAGGDHSSTTAGHGWNSGWSGGGGGCGAGESPGNVLGSSGRGGDTNRVSANGDGALGGTSNASAPTNGNDGTAIGMGGGGGGSATTATNAGRGGHGGIAGGGGGGGSNRSGSATRYSGAGGNGGNGYAEIISW